MYQLGFLMNKIAKHINRFKQWMNYSPPGALTTTGWRLFEAEFRKKAPIRYWIKKNIRIRISSRIRRRIKDTKYWIAHRTYDKYHVVDTGLAPGYYGCDKRMLHSSFNILKDFVEIELASSSYYWSDEYKNASLLEKYLPFYYIFKPFRRPDLGVKNLMWAATLDDPSLPPHEQSPIQAKNAREILILYKWWTKERPARQLLEIPGYSNQGLDSLMPALDDDFDNSAKDYQLHKKIMKKNTALEKQWEIEDTRMLVRLVKIREGLWT